MSEDITDRLQTIENMAEKLIKKHNLGSLNIWSPIGEALGWHCRAFRRNPQGFQASVESGAGKTIRDALVSLDERLIAGPINKKYIAVLDQAPKMEGER